MIILYMYVYVFQVITMAIIPNKKIMYYCIKFSDKI